MSDDQLALAGIAFWSSVVVFCLLAIPLIASVGMVKVVRSEERVK